MQNLKKIKNFINIATCQYKFAEAELWGSAGAAIMTFFSVYFFSLWEYLFTEAAA